MRFPRPFGLLLPSVFFLASFSGAAQDTRLSASRDSEAPEYPSGKVGVLIEDSEWGAMQPETPTKLRLKNGLAPVLTYGIAPARGVSEYAGEHAAAAVESDRPTICICHILSIPGDPVIVRLHSTRKSVRELNAGKIHVGGKLAKAESEDLVATDVAHPEDTVWVVRPRTALEPGEYALMLGVQNMSIYSFTVSSQGPGKKP